METAEFMENLPPTNDGSRQPQVHYVNSEQLSSAFSSMNSMRQRGQLCDISLQVTASQTLINAHKVVLAAASAYFSAMFTSKSIQDMM